MELTNAPTTTQYGETVLFSVHATVTAPVPAIGSLGTVQLWSGSTMLASLQLVDGSASWSINNWSVGTYTIHARYVQDDYYSAASVSVTHVVTVGSATTVLSTDVVAAQSQYGQPLQLSAAVSATFQLPNVLVGGTVTFLASGVSIGTSTLNSQQIATLVTNELIPGSYEFSAFFNSADGSYQAPVSNVVLHTVEKGLNGFQLFVTVRRLAE